MDEEPANKSFSFQINGKEVTNPVLRYGGYGLVLLIGMTVLVAGILVLVFTPLALGGAFVLMAIFAATMFLLFGTGHMILRALGRNGFLTEPSRRGPGHYMFNFRPTRHSFARRGR